MRRLWRPSSALADSDSCAPMSKLSLWVQLADFLTARVERAGGMMALPDVYCLFNRARGTELISPDDLLQVLAVPAMVRFAVITSNHLATALHSISLLRTSADQRQRQLPGTQ